MSNQSVHPESVRATLIGGSHRAERKVRTKSDSLSGVPAVRLVTAGCGLVQSWGRATPRRKSNFLRGNSRISHSAKYPYSPGVPPIINASGISKQFGLNPLFQNISFTVSERD